ncbi:transposase [Nonomuraea thailandensis]|uniref:transposase n=1 Tax=Nonomuraea thailandensis TaxID=1188745 RepID=UPI003CD0B904
MVTGGPTGRYLGEVLAQQATRAGRRVGALDIGRPPEHHLRDILNAILYVNRTGIPWRYTG